MLKLAIIEDNRQYSKALEFIFEGAENITIIHLLHTAENIIAVLQQDLPDIVIMDIDLPGKNGIEAVKEIKDNWPAIRIMMLTVFEDADKIFLAVKAGADGYLLKKDSPSRIIQAINELSLGESPINSIIAGKLLDYFQHQTQKSNIELYNLTSREKEILQHLINGHSYKEIAGICNITFQTLNSHTKNIYQKLNVHSRAEVSAKFNNLF